MYACVFAVMTVVTFIDYSNNNNRRTNANKTYWSHDFALFIGDL